MLWMVGVFVFGSAALLVPAKWVALSSLLACVACLVVFVLDRVKGKP